MTSKMRISESTLAWGCGCLLIACGGNSHRLGGEPDAGAAEGGTAGTTSTTGGQGGSNGGTASVSVGGSAAAGMGFGGTAGTSSGGFGAGIGTGCEQPLPDQSLLGCDAETAMRQHCARGGCHNAPTDSGNLDLTLDSLLIARVLDVPAKFETTSRGFGPCIQSTCPGSAMLVDSAAPESSWMLKKMAAFDFEAPSSAPDMGCGTAMPYPPGGTGFTSERHECLRSFFLAIAEFGVPCTVSSEPPPELPTCPEPE
jgi:hypothetical protein